VLGEVNAITKNVPLERSGASISSALRQSDPKELIPADPNAIAGCFLVRDDNFRLYEWVAYHCHILPLKRLIVGVDPDSQHSPEPVFDSFRRELNMSIVVWHDKVYGEWEPLGPNASRRDLRWLYLRQEIFVTRCMQHLNREGWTWVLTRDPDEFLVYNGYNVTKNNGSNSSANAPRFWQRRITLLILCL
jgi:hypothetical protein